MQERRLLIPNDVEPIAPLPLVYLVQGATLLAKDAVCGGNELIS